MNFDLDIAQAGNLYLKDGTVLTRVRILRQTRAWVYFTPEKENTSVASVYRIPKRGSTLGRVQANKVSQVLVLRPSPDQVVRAHAHSKGKRKSGRPWWSTDRELRFGDEQLLRAQRSAQQAHEEVEGRLA